MRERGKRCVYVCMTSEGKGGREREKKGEREGNGEGEGNGEEEGDGGREEILYTVMSSDSEVILQCKGSLSHTHTHENPINLFIRLSFLQGLPIELSNSFLGK